MRLKASRIAVLDVNHGALALAGELRTLGYDAFAVDVYGTRAFPDTGVEVVGMDRIGRPDAIAAPVHLPPHPAVERAREAGVPVLTHHRLAGMIVEETGRLDGMRAVEVTGTYGKTTACFILGRILAAAGERVLLHTSSGLCLDGEPTGRRLSVTPASVIAALDAARAADPKPTIVVLETSLGGCGVADVNVITTLDRDYPVAGGTLRSYTAKMQMIDYAKPGSVIVHGSAYCIPRHIAEVTFGPGGDVSCGDDGLIDCRSPPARIDPAFGPGLDIDVYRAPALCAVAAALAAGVRPGDISAGISGFEGVPGRMSVRVVEGRMVLDNSNSGLTPDGVARALERSRAHPGKRVLVVGEEKYSVCEGLDPAKALEIARQPGVDGVVLVGERLRGAGPGLAYAPGLEDGMTAAVGMTAPGDMIILCVKTWR
jgi:UDP-N-acetylmuramoylalanine--D-glutamate ligase